MSRPSLYQVHIYRIIHVKNTVNIYNIVLLNYHPVLTKLDTGGFKCITI